METKLTRIIDGVECYEQNGVAYLKLETCARGLGFTETKDGKEYVMWRRVDGHLKNLGFGTSAERPEFIPENIFYRLAMKAKNETAEAFQTKIADDIIPQIRRTGAYFIKPQTYAETLREAADLWEKNELLKAENEKQRQVIADYEPKVTYYDLILSSQDTMAISQIATDYGLTAQQLNKILYEEHIQHKIGGQWILYQEHMGKGYTKSQTIAIKYRNGESGSKFHTKWTQKGRVTIHLILEKRGITALMDR